jgi:excisionase family DNA binding protein
VLWHKGRVRGESIRVERAEGSVDAVNGKYFTIDEVCGLLGISRPTLNAYREKHGIDSVKVKGRVLLKKVDVLKLLYLPLRPEQPKADLTVLSDFAVEAVEVATGVFDLRRIGVIDPFGAICLLCCLRNRIDQKQHVYLLTGRDSASFSLHGMNFFGELTRVGSEYVHYDEHVLDDVSLANPEIITPLHLVGYRGGEKGLLDDIYARLRIQGFSEDLCASLGWTLGELADNATTHAGGPCYFVLSSMVGPVKFLTLTIGDTGAGIPVTLKTNPSYSELSDFEAFVNAFKSDVTSWDAAHKRGKGLNDLLAIAKGNGSWVRAETNGMGLFFDFREGADSIAVRDAGAGNSGTRYSMVLIDTQFEYVTKKEVNASLDAFLEKL